MPQIVVKTQSLIVRELNFLSLIIGVLGSAITLACFIIATNTLIPFLCIIATSASLILVHLFKKRLSNKVKAALAEVQQLESWANVSKIRGEYQLLTAHEPISEAIAELQKQLHDAKYRDSHFDRLVRANALLDIETGIGNHEFFNNRLEALLKEEDVQGAVYFIQFSECELVQSLYGHQQALLLFDNLINSVKHRLQHFANYFIARRGEFELALVVPGIFLSDTEKLAERLLKSISTVPLPVGINDESFVHIGVGYFSHAQTAYQIKAETDMALRSAQLQGPSQWFMYDIGEVENTNAKGSLRWRTFLTKAIENNAFVIFLQPVIDSEEGAVLHHEVLSKVRDVDGSLISARVFLPMAQKCGLAQTIDLLIFEQVCRLLTYDQGHSDDCSLNLSIESLLSSDFIEKFINILNKHTDIAPRIIVEVSEYRLVNHLEALKPVLTLLKQHGIKLLADKVGQYVVSAHYLKECPISYIKLHRSVVLDIDKKSENQMIVQSLKAMIEPYHIDIYALGVESIDEWRMLIRLGIDGGQGHYFTEPVAQVAKAIRLP